MCCDDACTLSFKDTMIQLWKLRIPNICQRSNLLFCQCFATDFSVFGNSQAMLLASLSNCQQQATVS